MVEPTASAQPAREPLKYGHTRASLRRSVCLGADITISFEGSFVTQAVVDVVEQ